MSDPSWDSSGRSSELPAGPLASAPVVEDLLRAISSTIRSYRLYSGNGPALERFVEALHQKFAAAWEVLPSIRLELGESSMKWEGQRVYSTGDSGGELAFLFYKDGIREITFRPGVENELPRLLALLARAPQIREDEDDLITLLWQESFSSFRYQYVDVGAEAGEPAKGSTGSAARVDSAQVRKTASEPSPGLVTDDFQETLYFLDEGELRRLGEEVRLERARDLWSDVLRALFDRLEDGADDRRIRIVRILSELLPAMLGGGDFARAAWLLGEMGELAARPGLLDPASLREVRLLYGHLSDPTTIAELARTLEGSPQAIQSDGLTALLAFFPPQSIAPLTRAIETVGRPDVRRVLESAVHRLAEANRDEVVRLLGDRDPSVVAGAVRWVGNLRIGSATGDVVPLLRHASAEVRLAAVAALVELGAAISASAIAVLLQDPEREVRIAAVRALGSLGYTAAKPALEAALESKQIRAADRTEKIAFFEAYGALGGAEGVAVLDKILNSRGWLGRGEAPEIRACAALGLARSRHPSARAALTRAANDQDPVVRHAVARALREPER
jgi:HEAT repeat protein